MTMFDKNLTYTKTITMVTEICCNCGVAFGIPSDLRDSFMKTQDRFFCPNGHGQSYTESTAEKLKRELQNVRIQMASQNADWSARLLREEREKKKLKSELKRVHNGVCPCCNRSFQDLQRHMKTKHPELFKEVQPGDVIPEVKKPEVKTRTRNVYCEKCGKGRRHKESDSFYTCTQCGTKTPCKTP